MTLLLGSLCGYLLYSSQQTLDLPHTHPSSFIATYQGTARAAFHSTDEETKAWQLGDPLEPQSQALKFQPKY